jgi:hypothetical protein
MTREDALIILIRQKGDCRKPHTLRCLQDPCPFYNHDRVCLFWGVYAENAIDKNKLKYDKAIRMYLESHSRGDLVEVLL